jgi:ABC-type dipeptide/oligopeptide/nickel transport system permease subunit
MMIAPGVALFLAIISVNLIGDRLSEIMDPRARGRAA